jgi:nucleoside-diphosphate-sugar epimerase
VKTTVLPAGDLWRITHRRRPQLTPVRHGYDRRADRGITDAGLTCSRNPCPARRQSRDSSARARTLLGAATECPLAPSSCRRCARELRLRWPIKGVVSGAATARLRYASNGHVSAATGSRSERRSGWNCRVGHRGERLVPRYKVAVPETVNPKRCVVVTGAAGAIGSLIVDRLGSRWQICPTDVLPGEGIEALDVTDFDRCVTMFEGADAVVHLAGNPDPDADWAALRAPNVEGVYTVAAAARECEVRRLVLASSLQAVSGYPETRQRRAEDAPRAANLYGATKAWAEALGSWVAATSRTSIVALRIGYFSERPPVGEAATPGNLAAWLSPGDCTRLIWAAVETDRAGLVVVNGISANRYRTAELGEAEHEIGYAPVDDSWDWLAQNSP